MEWAQVVNALTPYRVSWLAIVFFATAAFCYARGLGRLDPADRPGRWSQLAFWAGLALAYGVMHTRFDYYAQFMFFIHRGQHLILHHLAPLLVALSNPWRVLAAGFPDGPVKRLLAAGLTSRPVQTVYRVLQFPPLAVLLFVGLIYFWLLPDVHFYAMLSEPRYLLMNWSMWLDGLLFWWLLLDPRSPARVGTLGFGTRIILLWVATVPQLVLGAYIAVNDRVLFDVYEVCGRAWPLDPLNDQVLGGALTWIPPGMMAVLAMLVVLRYLMHDTDAPAPARTAHS